MNSLVLITLQLALASTFMNYSFIKNDDLFKRYGLQEEVPDTPKGLLFAGFLHIESDADTAHRYFEKASLAGDKEVQVYAWWGLGHLYKYQGNYGKARVYFEKVAAQSRCLPVQAHALFDLGRLYQEGQNDFNKEEIARGYYEKAALQTDNLEVQVWAWYCLAEMFANQPYRVTTNGKAARDYYGKVADQTIDRSLQALACLKLGWMYAFETDHLSIYNAEHYLEKAARQECNLLAQVFAKEMLRRLRYSGKL